MGDEKYAVCARTRVTDMPPIPISNFPALISVVRFAQMEGTKTGGDVRERAVESERAISMSAPIYVVLTEVVLARMEELVTL